MFTLEVEKLVNMMVHPCDYCEFSAGRCSEKNGCEIGIKEFLEKNGLGDEVRNS